MQGCGWKEDDKWVLQYGDKELSKTNGEEVISISKKKYRTYAIYITDNVTDNDRSSHNFWIGSAQFNPFFQ